MKYFIPVLSFVFAGEILARTLTLSEAQTLAAKGSSQSQVLEAQVAEARAREAVARSHNRPVVGIAGGGQLEGTARERELLPLAYAYTGVNLYNGGQTRILEKIAGNQIDKAQIEIPFQELQLKKRIEGLFAEIEMRNQLISIKQKEMKAFETHRRKANERRQAGLTGETDVLEFDLRKTSLSHDVETLSAERKAYFRILGLLTGEAAVDSIQGYSLPEKVRTPELDIARGSGLGLSSRILAKELSDLVLEDELQAARWGPKVDVEGRAGWLPKEGDTVEKRPSFDIMIVARLDLFNGLQKNAELQENLMKRRKLEAVITAENVDTKLLLDQSVTAMQNLEQKLKILGTNKISAERYYRATLGEYERGLKNSPDLAHATEILFETEYKALDIRYTWSLQKMKLETLLMREINERT